MSETTEIHRELDELNRDAKTKRRLDNTALVYEFCFENGILIEKLTDYHLRLTKRDYKALEVYPTNCKVKPIVKGAKMKIVDLKKYLNEYYVTKVETIRPRNKPNEAILSPSNGTKKCLDHIARKIEIIERNNPNNAVLTVLKTIHEELKQYLTIN